MRRSWLLPSRRKQITWSALIGRIWLISPKLPRALPFLYFLIAANIARISVATDGRAWKSP